MIDFSKLKAQPKQEEKKDTRSWWERTKEASIEQAKKDKEKGFTGILGESAKQIGKSLITPVIKGGTYGQNIISTGEDILGGKYFGTEIPSMLESAEKRRQATKEQETKAFNIFDFSNVERGIASTTTDIASSLAGGAGIAKGLTTIAPKVGGLFTMPKTVIGGIGQGAVTGGASEVPYKILTEGRLPTSGEVGTSAVVGGTVGSVLGSIPKIQKYSTAINLGGYKGLEKSISRDVGKIKFGGETITRAVPKKIVSGDLGFTPTERAKIEKITGKDEATYILEKGLAGKGKEELAGVFMKQSDDMYNGITTKLAKVDKRVQSNTAKEALQDIIDQLESKPKFQRAYADDIAEAKAMMERGDYTLSDLNNIRRAYDKVNTGMFTAQGAARSGIENEIDIKVRQALSDQLQKEAKLAGVDVKAMNNDLRAGLVMKDALLRRLSQEERNNFIGLQDLGVSAILSGGNPAVALGTVVAKKYAEKIAPGLSQKLYNLNKTPNVPRTVSRGNTIYPRNKSSLLNLTSDTVPPVAGKQVKPNPLTNGKIIKKSTTPEVQGTSSEIPKGFIRNPFNGKIEKINQSKKGSLNIGQIGKDLGIIKKPKAIGESVGKLPDEVKTQEELKKLYNKKLYEDIKAKREIKQNEFSEEFQSLPEDMRNRILESRVTTYDEYKKYFDDIKNGRKSGDLKIAKRNMDNAMKEIKQVVPDYINK